MLPKYCHNYGRSFTGKGFDKYGVNFVMYPSTGYQGIYIAMGILLLFAFVLYYFIVGRKEKETQKKAPSYRTE